MPSLSRTLADIERLRSGRVPLWPAGQVFLGVPGWRGGGCDVLPPGDQSAESVVPQPLAVLGADDTAQLEGGQSLAGRVEFPGRFTIGQKPA